MNRFFQKVKYYFLHGFPYQLGRLENMCLSAWIETLPPCEQNKMIMQRTRWDFVQRQLKGRLVVFSSPFSGVAQDDLRFDIKKGEYLLAVLSVSVDKTMLKTELWAFNGIFNSICYNKIPPKQYDDVVINLVKGFLPRYCADKKEHNLLPSDYDCLYATKGVLAEKGVNVFDEDDFTRIPILNSWHSVLCQIGDRLYITMDCNSANISLVLYDFIDDKIIKSGSTMQELLDFAMGSEDASGHCEK